MNHDWRDHGVKIIPSTGLDLNTPQTPGMTRAAAINRACAGANKLWAGAVSIHPNAKTARIIMANWKASSTLSAAKRACAGASSLNFSPKPARETLSLSRPSCRIRRSTPIADEPLICVVVRSDQEPIVVNLDIAAVEPAEEIPWVDPLHGNLLNNRGRKIITATMNFRATSHRLIALIFFLAASASVLRRSTAAAADLTLVQVGYGGIAGYQLPLWVNKDHGISKKYGIELEPLLISGGALNMQALLAGSIQMSQNSASSAIQAALRGAPVALIAVLENRMPLQIIARPEIKTPQQLIGKKIGILRFGGSNDTGVQWALRAWKIDPRQVTMLQSGATNARMTALTLGQIDATILSYPEIYIARKRGMNVLADIGDFSAYPNTSLLLTRSFIEKQRTLAKNLLRSQIEAIHYVRTDREGSIKTLKKYLRVDDLESIEATYDFFSRRTEALPRPNFEGLKNILKELGAPQRNPNDFVDMSLLDEIEKEGFLQKLR